MWIWCFDYLAICGAEPPSTFSTYCSYWTLTSQNSIFYLVQSSLLLLLELIFRCLNPAYSSPCSWLASTTACKIFIHLYIWACSLSDIPSMFLVVLLLLCCSAQFVQPLLEIWKKMVSRVILDIFITYPQNSDLSLGNGNWGFIWVIGYCYNTIWW